DGEGRDDRRPVAYQRGEVGHADAYADADDTAGDGHGEGLDEELKLNVAALRPYRHAQADFPRPLAYGHQHDVHDPDAADHERDDRDRREEEGLGLRHGDAHLLHVRDVADGEIVRLARGEMVLKPQEPLGRIHDAVDHVGRGGGDLDAVDPGLPGQPLLVGGDRHHHDVVLVPAEARLPLRAKDADHLERHALYGD